MTIQTELIQGNTIDKLDELIPCYLRGDDLVLYWHIKTIITEEV